MEFNVKWEELKTKVEETALKEELSSALLEFIDAFATMPLKPNTINPTYMGLCIIWLVDEICSEEGPSSLSWEMYLDLAKKWSAARGEAGERTILAIEKLIHLLTDHFNNDDNTVTLQEIDGGSVYYVLLLSETLSEPKKYFVAPNANSLAQANFNDKAWFRAIYAGRALVGFVMLYLDEEKGSYMVWRLMIG